MRTSSFPLWQKAVVLSLPCQLLAGCGGVDPLVVKELEVEELRYQSARMRESLSELISSLAEARAELVQAEEEKKSRVQELESLAASLRGANHQAQEISAQRSELAGKLKDAEEALERSQQSLARVKSIASASAGELADLRVKSRELEERLQSTTAASDTLRQESGKLSNEVQSLQAELVRTRAVLRSLQDRKETPAESERPPSQERVERMEREIANLRGENLALVKRLQILGAKESPPALPQTSESAGTASEQPENFVGGVAGALADRYKKALRGEIAWDGFDLLVLGSAGALFILALLPVIISLRSRRLVREVNGLRSSLRELEEGAARQAAEAEAAEGEKAESKAPRRAARKSFARRSGFSAVISKSDVDSGGEGPVEETATMTVVAEPAGVVQGEGEEDEAPAPRKEPQAIEAMAAGEDEDPFERLLKKAASNPAGEQGGKAGKVQAQAGGGTRRIIGARVWESPAEDTRVGSPPAAPPPARGVPGVAEGAGRSGQTDELASTQIIPSLTAMDLEDELRPVGGAGKKALETSRSTPDAAGRSHPEKAPDESKLEEEDRELLAELKSVINRKFDELLK